MSSMSSLLRRGGPLQGPRLILALFAVILVFFYLTRSTSSDSQGAGIEIIHDGPQPPDGERPPPISPGELPPQEEEKKEETMSDKFLDYLKGHSSHGHKSHSPVPHEEHASAAPPLTTGPSDAVPPTDPFCAHLPNASDLLVVVRTPASELYTQLPAHFFTTLRCVDFVLYSQVHQNIGPYTIYDALANISDARRSKHKDFELYDKLQDAQNAVTDLSLLKEDNEHNLDKWSIIPHVLAAYKHYPEKKWFAFIESDTYISLSNVLPWLSKLDPSEPLYAGAQVMIGDIELAHSGSGIILSADALGRLSALSSQRTEEWEDMVGKSCCGDKILAEALKEANITLHRSFPMIQGESPFSLDWSERHWCRTAMTWHRMTPASLDMMWQFEQDWARKHEDSPDGVPPMLFKDYYKTFLIPLIRASQNRTNWDNLASSLTYTDQSRAQYAHASFEACRAACDLRHTCVQYAWQPNKCRLGTVVRLGEGVKSDKRLMSGWHAQRVEKFGDNESSCKEEDQYLMPEAIDTIDEVEAMDEEQRRKDKEMEAEEERRKKEEEERERKEKEEKDRKDREAKEKKEAEEKERKAKQDEEQRKKLEEIQKEKEAEEMKNEVDASQEGLE